MDWVKAINEAISYMESNLTEEISLADIADSAKISVMIPFLMLARPFFDLRILSPAATLIFFIAYPFRST